MENLTIEKAIRDHTLEVFARKNFCIKATAMALRIDRKTLYRWFRNWGMEKTDNGFILPNKKSMEIDKIRA